MTGYSIPSPYPVPDGVADRTVKFDAQYFACVLGFIALNAFIRDYSGMLFLVFLAVSALYVTLRSAWIRDKAFIAFSGWGVFYIALSYLNVLPDAWTTLFDRSAIPQHASFVVAGYVLLSASAALWSWLLAGRVDRKMALLVGACLLGQVGNGLREGTGVTIQFSGLGNMMLPLYVVAGHYAFVSARRGVALGAAIALPTTFAQNVLIALFMIKLSLVPRPRTVVFGSMAALVAVSLVLAIDPYAVWTIDYNTGVRLFFWRDAMAAVVQTFGIGVGFGKEAVTNYIPILDRTDFIALNEEAVRFLYLSTHNSFVAMFFRLGLVGGLLFALCFRSWAPIGRLPMRELRAASFVYVTVFVALFVNVGLESPTYLAGIMLAVGYIKTLNSRAHSVVGS